MPKATSAPAAASRFQAQPALVFWETTKACLLACRHCRAAAEKFPRPGQLTTQEGRDLLRQIRSFSDRPPVVVFTGGDLLMRRDIFQLLQFAKDLGLHTAVAPSETPLLNAEAIQRLADAGATALSLSLDAMAATHDAIRGVPGTYEATLAAMRTARDAGSRCRSTRWSCAAPSTTCPRWRRCFCAKASASGRSSS